MGGGAERLAVARPLGLDAATRSLSATRPTKRERAELLTLALASLLVRGGERVALLGSGMRPITGRVAVRRLAETLIDRRASPSAAAQPAAARPLPAHGNVVLVGDFLAPLDEIEAAVRASPSAG